MKVVQLGVFDGGNGAAIAAYRLHRGLLQLGHDSRMFVRWTTTNDPGVTTFSPPRDLSSRVRRRLRSVPIAMSRARYRNSRPAGYEFFSDDRSPYGSDLLAHIPPCDVINIQSMFGFVDFRAFFVAVPQRTPVVRTLHDMSFFTGGCHHDAGCGKYNKGCGACPQLGSHNSHDLSHQIWERKYSAFSGVEPRRLHLVTPSRWLANEAKCSTLLQRFPVTVIPNGVNMEDFRPRDQGFAREILRIPQDARVVLFVAEPLSRPGKGFSLLIQALNEGDRASNLLLVSVGRGQPPVDVKVPYLNLGHIRDDRVCSLAYSAADIFAIPSLQDNLPNTVLEAMACGTPVIGFAVGGIVDMVRPGITGSLVPPQDVAALRAAICELLQDPVKRKEMAANCRDIAVKEYSLEVQAKRYVEVYETMLADYPSR